MRFVIVVNPHGGKKKGPRILDKVKPVFEAEGAELSIIETGFASHAQELAGQMDLDNYDGFLAIGGDGTLHEVVNGMLTRKDGRILPIGIIPGGSGNSYMHDLGLTEPLAAAKAIVRGKTRPVDVARVEIDHVVKYAINMVGWGMVTDVGKKAEHYRWLGVSRYTILSLVEILLKKSRAAALVMDDRKVVDEFTFIVACNTIHVGKGMKMAPDARLDDGLIDLVVLRGGIPRARLVQILPKLFDGSHLNEPEVSCHRVSEFSLMPEKNDILNIDGEIVGSTPVKVKMLKHAFHIFA